MKSKEELALDLAIVMRRDYDELLQPMCDGMGLTGAECTRVLGIIKKHLPPEDLLQWAAKQYAQHFDLEQLWRLVDFWSTETGQAWLKFSTNVQHAMGQKFAEVFQAAAPELIAGMPAIEQTDDSGSTARA